MVVLVRKLFSISLLALASHAALDLNIFSLILILISSCPNHSGQSQQFTSFSLTFGYHKLGLSRKKNTTMWEKGKTMMHPVHCDKEAKITGSSLWCLCITPMRVEALASTPISKLLKLNEYFHTIAPRHTHDLHHACPEELGTNIPSVSF